MTDLPKKRATKKDQLIKLLGTKSGCDITSLSAKLGWQQHTTRAALSGLRKAGYDVAHEKPASGGVSSIAFFLRQRRSRAPQQRSKTMGRDPNPERPATLAQWESVFGSPPPPYLSVPFMQKALAYEAQCKALRGLPTGT